MKANTINRFTGEHSFLSNFHPSPFTWNGVLWPTAEHAYQAAKTTIPSEQDSIRMLPTAVAAKHAGKLVTIRPDWNSVKIQVMTDIVTEKFIQNADLAKKLLATNNRLLVEGNYWHDRFWGVCPVESTNGRNELGKILMNLRDWLQQEHSAWITFTQA